MIVVWKLHQPWPAADRIVDPEHRVADLVEAARGGGFGAVGDVLAVDVRGPAPFAVVMTVEPEVQTPAEMEARVAERFDRDRAGRCRRPS